MPFRTFSDMNKSQPSPERNTPEEDALDFVSAPTPESGLFSRPRTLTDSSTTSKKMTLSSLGENSYTAPAGSTNELYLLEQAHVIGRKTELRQLLKLINLTRQGQPKAVLISGDRGIGKTALMDSFSDLVRQAVYTRIIDCRQERFQTPQHFYVTLIDSIRLDAERMIDEALAAINEGLAEVGLIWEAQDLIRAVSLVQMQEALEASNADTDVEKLGSFRYEPGIPPFTDKQRALTEEQLMKAIKNSVPTVKKLRLSLTGQVEKIVKLILNPWVITACHLINPIDSRLKNVFALSDDIKHHGRLFDPTYTKDWEAKRPQYFQMDDDASEMPDTIIISKNSNYTTVISPKGHSKNKNVSGQGPLADMATGLLYVLNFVNRTIATIDSSLLLMFDNWETIANLPYQQRDDLKVLINDVIEQCNSQSDCRLMFLVGCDSEQQSKSLGGPLFSQFRTKLLLSTLEESQARKLCKQTLQEAGLDIDERVHQQMMQLTQGNPYWHFRLTMYILERAKANHVSHINTEFFHQLCIEQVNDILELTFTRVKLACLEKEEALEKIIAALLVSFPYHPFRAGDAIREISLSQQLPESFVSEVFERLTHHQFLMPLLNQPSENKSKQKGKPTFENVWLVLQNKIDREFLRQKTTNVEADLPTDEKLAFLKKVIPLSIESGELDRTKTQEVLSLCHSLGNTDIVEYLETLFIKSLSADKPAVRVTAINNLALIDSERSRQALFSAMQDGDAMVREYAARNLNAISQSTTDPEFHRVLIDVLQDSLDDEYEAVRAQAYQTLGKYRWSHDLTMVFIKGLSDIDSTVRFCSVKFLSELEQESPFILNSLMDALDDPEPEVRKYACLGIQRYSGPEIIQAFITRLSEDTEPSIRALAADSLSSMEDESAFRALSLALMNPNESEDVKLAVVRTLGKHHSVICEKILLDALQQDGTMPPALLWASIRSLGQIATSERALSTLNQLQYHADNVIIQSAAKLALRKIQRRFSDHMTTEQQPVETATTIIQPFPSEYEQDIIVPEDEHIDLSS